MNATEESNQAVSDPRWRKQCVAMALTKMLRMDSHFSICTLQECLVLANVVATADELRPFHALHCVDWKDMPQDFRKQTVLNICLLFKRSPDFQFNVDEVLASVFNERQRDGTGWLGKIARLIP